MTLREFIAVLALADKIIANADVHIVRPGQREMVSRKVKCSYKEVLKFKHTINQNGMQATSGF